MAQFTRIEVANVMKNTGLVPLFYHPDVEIGKTYYYGQAMEMKNFKSKDLDRTFETILFLEGIYDNPQGKVASRVMAPNDEAHNKKGDAPRQEMNIQHEEGETTIGELYESKESLQNKKVTVKGIVTKYNPDIMGKNWCRVSMGTMDEMKLFATALQKVLV